MSKVIFRKEALQKMASPERLDEAIKVTKPGNWITLTAIFLLVASLLVWSFLGHITSYVTGDGILLNEGGISEVKTAFDGRLNGLMVTVGDTIQQGQVIATVEQLDKSFELKRLEIQQRALQSKYDWLVANNTESIRKTSMTELTEAKNSLTKDQQLLSQFMESNKEQYDSLSEVFDFNQEALTDLNEELLELRNYSEVRVLEMKNQLVALNSELVYKRNMLVLQSQIYSPYAGIVTEVMLNNGDVFNTSTTLLTLENSDYNKDELMALVYVDAKRGNRIKEGMQVFISPSTVQSEEYGYLEGEVAYVSRYPSTKNGMNRVLRNDKMVDALSMEGLPLAVEIQLKLDSTSHSGYKWTSGTGPKTVVVSGLLANAKIVVSSKAPITLVLPSLAETLE